MNYSEVFYKAWKYIWKHKVLWLFALFAGSLVGIGFGFPGSNAGNGMQYRFGGGDWSKHMPQFLQGRATQIWQDIRSTSGWMWVWVVISMIVVMLILTAISLFLSTAGRGGLIKGLLLAEDKHDDQPLSFKEVWQGMKPYFWRLMLLRMFIGIAVWVLGVIVAIFLVLLTIVTLGLALCLLIPLALLVIPIGWLVKAVVANASIALVDEDLDIFKAIAKAWQVVTNNVWTMLLVMFLNFLISVGAVLAVLLPFVLVTAPFILTGVLRGELSTALWVVLAILLILAFILALFIGMWANTLVHGIFVITYRRLKNQVTTPFGRTTSSTSAATVVIDGATTTNEIELNKLADPEATTGNEPASKEPDEASPEG